jgi:hypothetical protein
MPAVIKVATVAQTITVIDNTPPVIGEPGKQWKQ